MSIDELSFGADNSDTASFPWVVDSLTRIDRAGHADRLSAQDIFPEHEMAQIIQEFKQFAIRGNVMDLAVGVIIGGAFSTIVNSVVKDLIMPVIGAVTGGLDFSNKFVRIGHVPATFRGNPDSYKDLQAAGVAVFGYGAFITVVLNFLILAVIVFLLVKAVNELRRLDVHQAEQTPAAPAPPSEDILLLREIRDALKRGDSGVERT